MAESAIESLSYAARPAVVAKRIGQLALLFAGLTLAPLMVAAAAGESGSAWRYAASAAVLGAGGAWLARRDAPDSIQANEALVICALAFVLPPLAITYPLMASGLGFGEALFESISGITTTGLSVVRTVEDKPASFLFERAWLQWIGGLGIGALSVALLAGSDVAQRHLIESPVTPETLESSTRVHARRSVRVYVGLTLAAVLLLWLAGWGAVDAALLALAAVSTGGFAPHDASAAAAPWAARTALIGVAVLGAVALPLTHAAWRTRGRAWIGDPQLRALLLAGVLGAALLMLVAGLEQGGWTPELAAHALAMAFSAQSTSGFATVAPAQLGEGALLVMIGAMAVGGGLGSTAGGIKLLRLLLVLKIVHLILRRAAMPRHAITPLRVGGHEVSREDLSGALVVVMLFVATVGVSWLPFLVLGEAPLPALFDVVSAVSTTGLSAGVVRPQLHPLLQGVLCIDMLLGRLEFIALLVMLFPPTWIGRRRVA